MRMRRKTGLVLVVVFSLLIGMLPISEVSAKGKVDKKKPTVKLTQTELNWTKKSVQVNVSAKDKSGIKSIHWCKGKVKKTASKYWLAAKSIKKKKYFKAPENGWYSVKVVDKKGNKKIKQIQISNIDKTGPTGSLKYTVKNKIATINVTSSDPRGVVSTKWAQGYITKKGVSNFPNEVTNNSFTGKSNGYYTVRLQDGVGNVSLVYVKVELWKDLRDLKIFDRSHSGVFDATVYDRWGKMYSNPIGISAYSGTISYIEYDLNGAYKRFSGTVFRGKDMPDKENAWFKVYIDDACVYSSKIMNYKTEPFSFDIDIKNGRYLKIYSYSEKYDGIYGSYSEGEGIYFVDTQLYN